MLLTLFQLSSPALAVEGEGDDIVCDEVDHDRLADGTWKATVWSSDAARQDMDLQVITPTGAERTWVLKGMATLGGRVFEWRTPLGVLPRGTSVPILVDIPEELVNLGGQESDQARDLTHVSLRLYAYDELGRERTELALPKVWMAQEGAGWIVLDDEARRIRAPHGVLGALSEDQTDALSQLEALGIDPRTVRFIAPIRSTHEARVEPLLDPRDEAEPSSLTPNPLPNTSIARDL